jgi:butyryl-CoA dehydrogenase
MGRLQGFEIEYESGKGFWVDKLLRSHQTKRKEKQKENKKPHTREASMAKLYASEAANRIAYRAVQVHGGAGDRKSVV